MATIKFSIKSKKNFAPIYVRMQHSRLFDFEKPLNFYINPKNFDLKNQRIKRVLEIPNADELNESMINLRNHLFTEFNSGMIHGTEFNRIWFNNCVNKFFNRVVVDKIDLHKIFFTDWCNYWIDNIAPTYKVNSDKYISGTSLKNYKTFITIFSKFQDKKKIKFRDMDLQLLEQFADYMIKDSKYGHQHTKRLIDRLKFFCAQAEKNDIQINKAYQDRIFISTETKKDSVDPYLSEKEIKAVFDHDFSDNERLDNVRDNLIISVWTGLRISDFLRLRIDNIVNNTIEIRSTQKTGIGVVIPIHPQVRAILEKRGGNLPKSISDQKYNEYVKEVTQAVGLTEIIYGSKLQLIADANGVEVSRKVQGNYPKYQLISSHIGRRSFATNLFGKVPNSVIMATGGWKSEQMMLKYIKKTKNDHVAAIQQLWNKEETILKVVNE